MAQYSAFEIIGPAMIGPSSSHTAGAVRIGLAASAILGETPASAKLELHGSFASTGKGHATDRALIAGLLGWMPDDPRLKNALAEAEKLGLALSFDEVDLGDDFHPNSVRLTLRSSSAKECVVVGSSIGGGAIQILEIDGFNVRFDGSLYTLIFWHQDKVGFLAHATSIIAKAGINIASIHTTRKHRQSDALTTLETDDSIAQACVTILSKIEDVEQLHIVPKLIR